MLQHIKPKKTSSTLVAQFFFLLFVCLNSEFFMHILCKYMPEDYFAPLTVCPSSDGFLVPPLLKCIGLSCKISRVLGSYGYCKVFFCFPQVEIQVRKLHCLSRTMPLPINLEDAARSEQEIEEGLEV